MRTKRKKMMMSSRSKIIHMTYKAGGCHLGSALSCVEIVDAIFDLKGDKDFLWGKASGVATLYARLGYNHETLKKYPLPSKEVKGLVWSGGSVGMGLGVACGMALAGDEVYVLIGEGDLQEGSTWEAIQFAAHHNLKIRLFIDRNHLQALGNTEDILGLEPIKEKFEAFGWEAYKVNGNNKEKIEEVFYDVIHEGTAIVARGRKDFEKPVAVICETTKGNGVSFIEGDYRWHYKNLSDNEYKRAIFQNSK